MRDEFPKQKVNKTVKTLSIQSKPIVEANCTSGYVLTDGKNFLLQGENNSEYDIDVLTRSILRATKFSSLEDARGALSGPHTKANHGSKEVAKFSKKYVIQEISISVVNTIEV